MPALAANDVERDIPILSGPNKRTPLPNSRHQSGLRTFFSVAIKRVALATAGARGDRVVALAKVGACFADKSISVFDDPFQRICRDGTVWAATLTSKIDEHAVIVGETLDVVVFALKNGGGLFRLSGLFFRRNILIDDADVTAA